MITKERLEELIKQGATIYKLIENEILEYNIFNNPDLRSAYKVVNNELFFSNVIMTKLEDLFETKEDAEFAQEFKDIKRMEVLNLPTFEELKKFERFDFKAKDGHRYTIHFISGSNILVIVGIFKNEYYGEATKENYIEACKIVKNLFIGENKDEN